MKVSEFNQTMAYLLKPKPKMQVAELDSELEKTLQELNEKFGPGTIQQGTQGIPQPPIKTPQAIFEFEERMKGRMADGGRVGFADAGLVTRGPNKGKYFLRYKPVGSAERVRRFFDTNEELQNFIKTRPGYVRPTSEILEIAKDLKKELKRLPTQTEVANKAGISIQAVKNRLKEGVDFAKPLTKLEAAKLGGRKRPDTAVSEVSDDLVKKYRNLKQTHVSPLLETTTAGSKIFRVSFTGPIANDFKDFSLPATEKNFKIIKEKIDDVVTSNVYKNKARVYKTPEDFRKLRRLKESIYRKKDPFGVYEKLRRFKSKVFPGDFSKDIQIQHGQPKFTTQSLNRFGFIDKDVNISPAVEFTERIRNEEVGKLLNRLKTKRPLEIKKSLIEDFNNKMKALKGQLKGTKGQGLVNFELFKIDNQGKVSKLKDVGFNPKKGLVASDEDLSKITKERANQLINEGKKKILREGYRRGFLDKAGKVLKGAGKVIKPIGYAFGANAVKSAISQADEINLDLSPVDLFMALDSGDASVALNNARRRVDPEFATQERAKDLAKMKDDFEEVGLNKIQPLDKIEPLDDIGMQEYTEDYMI
jgi:hypothetical protein